MAGDSIKKVYWDACVFLSYIEGRQDRVGDIEAMLEAAEKGKVHLLTSTLSIVEVAYAKEEKDGKQLTTQADVRIKGLWLPPSPITLIEFYPAIAHLARDFMRAAMTRGWSLRPADAIHLATTKIQGIGDFQTYDGVLDKYAELVGFSIRRPPPVAQFALEFPDPPPEPS